MAYVRIDMLYKQVMKKLLPGIGKTKMKKKMKKKVHAAVCFCVRFCVQILLNNTLQYVFVYKLSYQIGLHPEVIIIFLLHLN